MIVQCIKEPLDNLVAGKGAPDGESQNSSTTTAGHTPFVNPRCCEYSLIELLMMGVGYARNMYSDLQEIIK
jgi:hypothetical protein